MALRRCEAIRRPDDFRVTSTRLTQRFNLYLDEDHGYLKQVARLASDPTPTVYYRLEQSATKRRPSSQRSWIRPLRFSLAALLIVGAMLLAYPYYPGVQYQVSRQVATTVKHQENLVAAPAAVSTSNHLTIPKIGVDTAILEGPDLSILDREDGVWHQTGAQADGNLVLAGHRFKYLPPNTSTLYNLKLLAKGDSVIIDWNHTRYTYVIDNVMTIPSTQTKILKQTGGPRLTIYTCTNASQTMRTVIQAHRLPL